MANQKNTIEVKVVGPTVKSIAPSIAEGDKVVVRLGTYAADPTSIKLETIDGNEIGYVAAQAKTSGGYPLAKDVYSMVKEGDTLNVVSTQPNFIVEIPKVETEGGTTTCKFETTLNGNKLEYPNRMRLSSEVRKSKTVKLDYKVEDNKSIIFIFEGVPCGIASSEPTATAKATLASKGIKLSSTEEIIDAIANAKSVVAEAQFLDGYIVPVEFTVELEEKAIPVAKVTSYDKVIKGFAAADQAEMQKRISWLKTNNVAEYAIGLFIKKMEGHENIQEFKPEYIPHGKELENAIAFSYAQGNLLLVGPAGSGKNVFLATFANLMDLELVDKSCSAGVDEEGLFGYLSMKPSEEAPNPEAINAAFRKFIAAISSANIDKQEFANSSVEKQIEVIQEVDSETDFSVLFDAMRSNTASIQFEPSVITKAMEKPTLINLDEVNTLRATTTAAMHAMLDKRRSVLINGYRQVPIHKDVIFTATMNEGNDYAGTSMLNMAFEDRWHVIEFEAPDNIAEILKQEVPTLPAKAVKILNELYKKIKAIRGVEIQERSFSQRAFIYAAQNIALGNDVKSAIMSCIVPKIRDAEDREAVKSIVDLMIK